MCVCIIVVFVVILDPRHALDYVSSDTALSSSAKEGMHEL